MPQHAGDNEQITKGCQRGTAGSPESTLLVLLLTDLRQTI